MKVRNVPQLILQACRSFPERTAFPRASAREEGAWTFRELEERVRRVGAALWARGVRPGDRGVLLSGSRRCWFVADLAFTGLGGIDVPRGADTTHPELRALLRHSQPRWAFVESPGLAAFVEEERDALPELREIFLLPPGKNTHWTDLETLAGIGEELLQRGDRSFQDALDRVGPDQLLTLVYTSGTTGDPRGVMLSHGNVLSNILRLPEIVDLQPGEICLGLLPLWHVLERTVDYYVLSKGCSVCFTDKRRFKKDLRQVGPSLMATVPRVWENIYDTIQARLEEMEGLRGKLARRLALSAVRTARGEASLGEKIFWKLLGRGMRARTREALGGRLRCAVSGGGSLAPHVDGFLVGAGVPLLNGYGLTETSPVLTCRRLEKNKPFGVGFPLSDTEIQVRDEEGRPLPPGEKGRIFARGPQVMRGYYKNPEATRRVLSREGWLDTGDLGRLHPDGSLEITGRAKETIVLAGGENVEPSPLEAVLTSSPLISQAMLVGQDRRRPGAILVPDQDRMAQEIPPERWRVEGDVHASPEVRELFARELKRLCTQENGFRPFERIGPFLVLARPFTPENGLLTPTLKIRRLKVLEKYGSLIDDMFREKERVPAAR